MWENLNIWVQAIIASAVFVLCVKGILFVLSLAAKFASGTIILLLVFVVGVFVFRFFVLKPPTTPST